MSKYKITSRKGVSVRASRTYSSRTAAYRGANTLAKRYGKTYYIYQRNGRWKYVGKVQAIKRQVRRDDISRRMEPVFDTVMYLGALQVSVSILKGLTS